MSEEVKAWNAPSVGVGTSGHIGQIDSGDRGNDDEGGDDESSEGGGNGSGGGNGGDGSGDGSNGGGNGRGTKTAGGRGSSSSKVEPGEDERSRDLIARLPAIADESTEHGFIHPGLALYTR